MIDRRRRTGAQGNTQVAEHQHCPGHSRPSSQKHADQRGNQHQHHNLGLGQFQIVTPRSVEVGLAQDRGHDNAPFAQAQELSGRLKPTCVGNTSLKKTASECSFRTPKLRFFGCFRLVLPASPTFFNGLISTRGFPQASSGPVQRSASGLRSRSLISTSTSKSAAPPPLCATATASGRCSNTLATPRPSCIPSASTSKAANLPRL